MNLGQAITLLKEGHEITRKEWNGKNMYLVIAKFAPSNIKETVSPVISLFTSSAIHPGWTPSQSDLFADDFIIYNNVNHNKFNLDFNIALQLVKQGFKLSRKGWNGKNQYIFKIDRSKFIDLSKEYNKLRNNIWDAIGFMSTTGLQVGWIATSTDMLSNDWYIVDDSSENKLNLLDKEINNKCENGLSFSESSVDYAGVYSTKLTVDHI